MRAALIAPKLDNVFKTPDTRSQDHFEPGLVHQNRMVRSGQNAILDLREGKVVPTNIKATEMGLLGLARCHGRARPVRSHHRPEARHQLQARKNCQRQNKNFNQRLVPQR